MVNRFTPQKKLNHYPQLAIALNSTVSPDRSKAENIAAGFTLPPNLCFGADGLERIATCLSLSEFASDQFANVFGYITRREFQAGLDAAAAGLSRYALSEIEKEKSRQDQNQKARKKSPSTAPLPSQAEAILLPMSRATAADQHPLKGYALDSCPIWSVLFCEPTGPADRIEAYQKLVADISILCALYIVENTDTQGYEAYLAKWAASGIHPDRNPLYTLRGDADPSIWLSRLLNGFRALRKMSNPSYAQTLARLHRLQATPFSQRFEIVMHDEFELTPNTNLVEKQSFGYQALRNIRLLLELVRPDLFPQLLGPNPNTSLDRDGSGSTADSVGHVRISRAWFIHLQEQYDDPYFNSVSEIAALDGAKALEVHGDSWAPDELLAAPLAHQCEISEEYESVSRAAKALLSSRSEVQAKRYNNRSALDNTTLTQDEIAEVMRFLSNATKPSGAELNTREKASAYLHAMLVTGRSADDIKTLTITTEPETSLATICFHPVNHEWHILLTEPNYQTQQSSAEISNQRPLANRLVLPDDSGFAQRLLPFTGSAYRLINRHTDALKKEIDHQATSLSSARAMPESRIRAALWQELMRISNFDYALGFIITANPVAHARTTAYYATYSLSYVQARYQHALKALMSDRPTNELGRPKQLNRDDKARIYKAGTNTAPSFFIGARYCPTGPAIKDLLDHLTTQLTRKPGRSTAQLIRYHNAYTLYSFVVIALGTALRGVSDPAPDFVAQDTGWVGFSEKCRVDLDRRVIPATDIVMAQLNNLKSHNAHAIERFPKVQSILSKHLYTVSLVATKPELVPLSERSWKILTPDFALPMNAFRHYVRTRLIELGTDPSYVDALLGHWAQGCAPFDEFSGMSPLKFQQEITETINALYSELGVQARRSHFQR